MTGRDVYILLLLMISTLLRNSPLPPSYAIKPPRFTKRHPQGVKSVKPTRIQARKVKPKTTPPQKKNSSRGIYTIFILIDEVYVPGYDKPVSPRLRTPASNQYTGLRQYTGRRGEAHTKINICGT